MRKDHDAVTIQLPHHTDHSLIALIDSNFSFHIAECRVGKRIQKPVLANTQQFFSFPRTCNRAMRRWYIFLSTMFFIRRNNLLIRAYAVASKTPQTSSYKSFSPRPSSSLFSSTDVPEKITSSSDLQAKKTDDESSFRTDKYLSIAAQQEFKSFGGLSYCEIPDGLQRVVFVLGGPGSGKVS